MKLKTRDILNLEILSTGTFHGMGSPPEGDAYSVDDLDGIVEAATALPLKRPAKLGHNREQQFAQADGLPSVGWLENIRRVGEKLLADVKAVPDKVADLIEAGAYRTRSPELIFNYPDPSEAGKVWPRVLTGVAFLGADIPACTTIDDIVALYEGKLSPADLRAYVVGEAPEGELHTYEGSDENGRDYAIMLPLSEEGSYESVKRAIEEAFPKVPGTWWWVERTYPTFAVVQKCVDGPGPGQYYVIPYARGEGSDVTLGPESEWQEVEQEQVFVRPDAQYTEGAADDPDLLAKFSALMEEMEGLIHGKTGAPRLRVWISEAQRGLAVIARQAAKQVAGTEGQKVTLAAVGNQNQNVEEEMKQEVCLALGLPEDTPDVDVLAKIRELHQQTQTPPPDLKNYIAKDSREYQELSERAQRSETKLFEMERDRVLDRALAEGRILPADLEQWQADYAASPELTIRHLEALPKTVVLAPVGSAGGGGEQEDLSDPKALAEAAKKYQAEHPADIRAYREAHPDVDTDYEAALALVEPR